MCSGVSLIGVGNRVQQCVKFVCTVCSASGPVVAVVGDGRSGDPLHERCDESDVYECEVAQVDMIPELVWRFDGVVDGLRSLVDVARGSVCAPASLRKLRNGLPIRPYVSITSGMKSLFTARAASLYLPFFSATRFAMGSPVGAALPWRVWVGLCVVFGLCHDVCDGGVYQD